MQKRIRPVVDPANTRFEADEMTQMRRFSPSVADACRQSCSRYHWRVYESLQPQIQAEATSLGLKDPRNMVIFVAAIRNNGRKPHAPLSKPSAFFRDRRTVRAPLCTLIDVTVHVIADVEA